MNHRLVILSSLVVFALLLCASGATAEGSAPNAPASPQAALGTAFTYQGRLDQSGSPASGTYDFRFRLYDDGDAGEGTQLGEVEVGDMSVSSGLFSVELDFGSAFDTGTATWLEIGVRAGTSTGSYTTLSPRQVVNAAPYALYARSIPLSGSGSATTAARSDHTHQGSLYDNVVVVAKSGGDTTTVQGAIDSITDASEDNPYLVWVAPGEYVESVTMKPYVHLQGASQETTVISSTVTNDEADGPLYDATMELSSHVTVRDLEIVNSGAGEVNVALLAPDGLQNVEVSDVNILAQGSSSVENSGITTSSSIVLNSVTVRSGNGLGVNMGMFMNPGSELAVVQMFDCVLVGGGGTHSYGIFNTGAGSILFAKNSEATGRDSNFNIGLYNNEWASASLEGGSFIGDGSGDTAKGILNENDASLTAKYIYAGGKRSSNNEGVRISDSTGKISHSVIAGSHASLRTVGVDAKLYASFTNLEGNQGFYEGLYTCTAMVYDNAFYPDTCP
jgi:hypothetical protein